MNNELIKTRQDFPLGWLLIAILALLLFITGNAGAQTPRPDITRLEADRIESVGYTVSDVEKAAKFYREVLGFEQVSSAEVWGEDHEYLTGVFGVRMRIVRLKLGDEIVELTEYLTPQGRPVPIDSRSNDKWFQHIAIIVSDMDKAYDTLRKNMREYGIKHASPAPQTLPAWNKNAGDIRAFYFKDPDGHVLEILQFPEGKGRQKWHDLAKTGKVFLGIDHTAIVVGDSSRSLEFYRDALGLSVAGTSDNYGSEQERLNNVFGARLHITGLSTRQDGVNVEFLEYLAPADGRPYPKDSRSNDLWHWQTSFVTRNAAGLLAALAGGGKAELISSGTVSFSESLFGFGKGALVRDPDGHAIRFVEAAKPRIPANK